MTRQVRVALLTAFLIVGLATGCESERGSTPSPTGTMPAPTGTGPTTAGEHEALAAYRGMWDAFVEAGKTSNPDAPAIRRYASDQALRLIVGALATNRQQGKVIKGDLRINPRIADLKGDGVPTEATVQDCVDSTNWLEYKTSGELWDDEPGGKHRTTAVVRNAHGVWKVSKFTLERSGTC